MQKKSLKYWLTWVGVLPGALLAGALATFPFHWLLYALNALGLFDRNEADIGSVKFFVQLFGNGVSYKDLEYAFYPFVIAVTFIIAGYHIAPSNKFKTSVVLAILYSLFMVAAVLFAQANGLEPEVGVRTVGVLLGLLLGLFWAWKTSNHKS